MQMRIVSSFSLRLRGFTERTGSSTPVRPRADPQTASGCRAHKRAHGPRAVRFPLARRRRPMARACGAARPTVAARRTRVRSCRTGTARRENPTPRPAARRASCPGCAQAPLPQRWHHCAAVVARSPPHGRRAPLPCAAAEPLVGPQSPGLVAHGVVHSAVDRILDAFPIALAKKPRTAPLPTGPASIVQEASARVLSLKCGKPGVLCDAGRRRLFALAEQPGKRTPV